MLGFPRDHFEGAHGGPYGSLESRVYPPMEPYTLTVLGILTAADMSLDPKPYSLLVWKDALSRLVKDVLNPQIGGANPKL